LFSLDGERGRGQVKKLFVVIAIVSLLASASILLFRPMSLNLDKRILVAIGVADTLLLLLLIVISRRIGEWPAFAFALAGLVLAFGTYSVANYPWQSRSTAERIQHDLQQIREHEKKSP
jgi:cytochrome bd-type quinol oxidase subunit 2